MDNIFERVKQAVSVPQIAQHYGIPVDRSGKCCCLFHPDKHPSMKLNEDYYYCFSCGATGDVIDLVARLCNLGNYEAAQRLADDFGISNEPRQPTAAKTIVINFFIIMSPFKTCVHLFATVIILKTQCEIKNTKYVKSMSNI